MSPAGNDLLFEDSLPEQGRNLQIRYGMLQTRKSWNIDEKLISLIHQELPLDGWMRC